MSPISIKKLPSLLKKHCSAGWPFCLLPRRPVEDNALLVCSLFGLGANVSVPLFLFLLSYFMGPIAWMCEWTLGDSVRHSPTLSFSTTTRGTRVNGQRWRRNIKAQSDRIWSDRSYHMPSAWRCTCLRQQLSNKEKLSCGRPTRDCTHHLGLIDF